MPMPTSSFLLSRQEQRVVSLSMEGLGDKEVASSMGLAIGTVRTYWKRIGQKTGAQTRAEVVATIARSRNEEVVESLRAEIEAQRESEARFQAACECAPVGLALGDPSGALTYVNAAWERIFGLARERALGTGYLERVVSEDRAHFLNPLETTEAFEFRVRCRDRETRWLRARLGPFIVRGRCVGFVGTVEIVSEHHAR